MNSNSQLPRYTDRPFPKYSFLPGQAPHPEKEGGHHYGVEIKTLPLQSHSYRQHGEYLYGLDLFNFHFHWEAHVYWEAIWHKVGRKGEVADFLKSLILLAAAGVKWRLGQRSSACGHLARAVEILSLLPPSFYGLDLKQVLAQVEGQRQLAIKKSFQLRLLLFDLT